MGSDATNIESVHAQTQVTVSVRDVSKSFGPTKVLHDVSLDIRAGEVLVLLGPNGAGKSTLLNILGGSLAPSSGELLFEGRRVEFESYDASLARAIGMQRVFQELSIFPNLTVAENLSLTSLSRSASPGRARSWEAKERMAAFPGNRIPVDAPVSDLSIAERQMVEIVRATTEPGTRLVILDEPTSALSSEEADQLSDLVLRKAREGVAIIYVTHKLEEAVRLADRVVVLRDGRLHFDGPGRGLTHDQLLTLLGASNEKTARSTIATPERGGSKVVEVSGLTDRRLRDIEMHVGVGEIVGIAGLEGAGQRELLQALFAARGRDAGAIKAATDIAYVSGDRKREGLLPLGTVADNVSISAASQFSYAGLVNFSGLRETAMAWLDDLGLAHRADSAIVSLSGGNQQRALLGRALASEAPLLLLDDPTRGVDASAKASIYAILDKVRGAGRSAILYSTEVTEFARCDRVYVMARGRIVDEFVGADASEERIVRASFAHPTKDDAAVGRPVPTDGSTNSPTVSPAMRFLTWRALPAAFLMVGMFVLAFWQQPNALSTFGLDLLLQASLPLAFAVIAQMLFLLGGDIDLGLGFAIGLVNVLAATYLVDMPLVGGLALSGVVAGYVLLAVLVERLGVSSVVATLGASFVWLGIGLMIRETPGGRPPEWLSVISQVKLWPLPLACYVLVLVALIGLWLCRGWGYSVRLRALGQNRRTYLSLGYSALAGRITLYALAGLFAVLSGLFVTAATGAGNANVATNFTLATIAAVVVGGASFAGGIVSPIGAVMAVVGISLITTNLVFFGVSSEFSTAIGGLVLIIALSFRSMTSRSTL